LGRRCDGDNQRSRGECLLLEVEPPFLPGTSPPLEAFFCLSTSTFLIVCLGQEKTWTASTTRSFHHVKCDALALHPSALRFAFRRAQTGSVGVYDTFRA